LQVCYCYVEICMTWDDGCIISKGTYDGWTVLGNVRRE